MPKLSDIKPDGRFVGLFVGKSGSGKTVAAASFPKEIHVDDFDGRIRGVLAAKWLDTTGINYEYYPPKSEGLIPKINNRLEALMITARQGGSVPKTYITDSITNMNYAFICQSIPLTHQKGEKGKFIGTIAMPGPEDYGLEAQGCYDYVAFMKSLPIQNIIMTAHIVDRYGKADSTNSYSESIVMGEKLSIRDKIGENVQTHFDHIFKFESENGKYYVTFHSSGIARTSFSGLPKGRVDVTNANFYEKMMEYVMKEQTNVVSTTR